MATDDHPCRLATLSSRRGLPAYSADPPDPTKEQGATLGQKETAPDTNPPTREHRGPHRGSCRSTIVQARSRNGDPSGVPMVPAPETPGRTENRQTTANRQAAGSGGVDATGGEAVTMRCLYDRWSQSDLSCYRFPALLHQKTY